MNNCKRSNPYKISVFLFLSIIKQLASNNTTNICKSDQNKQNKIWTATALLCTIRLKCKYCIHVHNDLSKHVVLHDVMEHAVYNKNIYIHVTLALEDAHSTDCTYHINLKKQLFLLQEQAMQENTKMQVFWDVTPCRASSYRRPLCLRHVRNHSPNALSHPRTCIFSSTAKTQILHKCKH
jgi:hypothetical protein